MFRQKMIEDKGWQLVVAFAAFVFSCTALHYLLSMPQQKEITVQLVLVATFLGPVALFGIPLSGLVLFFFSVKYFSDGYLP